MGIMGQLRIKNHKSLIQEVEQWKQKRLKCQERNRTDIVQFTTLSYDKVTNVTSKSGLLPKREICIPKEKKKKSQIVY